MAKCSKQLNTFKEKPELVFDQKGFWLKFTMKKEKKQLKRDKQGSAKGSIQIDCSGS